VSCSVDRKNAIDGDVGILLVEGRKEPSYAVVGHRYLDVGNSDSTHSSGVSKKSIGAIWLRY
jgi:hypothetical protein